MRGRRPMAARRISIARCPTAWKSWRTVVRGGMRYAASGMSSKPTTLTPRSPSGTPRPASCSARSRPSAIWSLAQKTARDVVAGRDPQARLVAAGGRPVAGHVLARPQPGGVHRVVPALQPGARLGPLQRTGEVDDVGVPEVDQVLGAELGAGDLVDADGPAGLVGVALDDDDRDAEVLLGAGDLERVVGRGDEDDALDRLAAEVVDRVDELLARRGSAGWPS